MMTGFDLMSHRTVIQSQAGRLIGAFLFAAPLTVSIFAGGVMLIAPASMSINDLSFESETPSTLIYSAVQTFKPDHPDIQTSRVVYVPRWSLEDQDLAPQIVFDTRTFEPLLEAPLLSRSIQTRRDNQFSASQSHDLPI